jgi:hypothetical protein
VLWPSPVWLRRDWVASWVAGGLRLRWRGQLLGRVNLGGVNGCLSIRDGVGIPDSGWSLRYAKPLLCRMGLITTLRMNRELEEGR